MTLEGLNRSELLGNIGSCELRHTQGGHAVLNIRLATNERIKSGEEWKDHAEWHNIVVWGARAEALGKILDKGSAIFVAGRLRTSEYEGRDGQKRWKTEIHADQVLLLGGRPQERQQQPSGGYQQQRPAAGGDFA